MRIRSIAPVLGVAAFGLSLATLPALSADYPVLRGSQIEDAPAPPDYFGPGFNWTGIYFGGYVGTSRTELSPGNTGLQEQYYGLANSLRRNQDFNLPNNKPAFFKSNDSGANFGGFLGYNLAFGDAVLGIEADYTRLDHSYSLFGDRVLLTSVGGDALGVIQAKQDLNDYGSARLRLGYAVGRFMPYATFGVAVGRGTSTIVVGPDAGFEARLLPDQVRKKDSYMYGLTAGLGLDAAVTDNLFLRAEYLFTRFDSFDGSVIDINNVRVGAGLKF